MAFAETALGQVRSLGQSASPRNYEIWYAYASGYNAPLNQSINETLACKGGLSEADLGQIYETHFSHLKTQDKAGDRIDEVGERVLGEIDDVMTLLTAALGASASYDASLDGADEKLMAAESRHQVKTIVETLANTARDMREANKALEERLALSRAEIGNLQQALEAI